MQAMDRNAKVKSSTAHHQSYGMSGKDGRYAKPVKPGRGRGDDCSVYDKLPKQIDDIVEGESPKRFKRPKMASDIVAR